MASVVSFLRPGREFSVLVLANVADSAVEVDALTLSGLVPEALDLVSSQPVWLGAGITLAPHGVRWLRVRMR